MKRFCKGFFGYLYFLSCISSLFFLIAFLGLAQTEDSGVEPQILLYIGIAYVFFIIVSAIYQMIAYRMTGYSLNETDITTKKGVLFKRQSVLQYEKIHAMNKKQGLIQRLFHVQGLYVDSGSTNTSSLAEIVIYDTPENIEALMVEIQAKRNHLEGVESGTPDSVSEQTTIFEYTKKDKVFFSLTSLLYSLIFLVIVSSIVITGLLLFRVMGKEVWIGFVIFFFIIIIIGFLCGIFISFLGYFNFKVSKNKDYLNINYGLFVKVQHKLPLEKVMAVRIHEGWIQRMLGFASLKLDIVGFNQSAGNEPQQQKASIGVLIPFCKRQEVEHYLEQLLPKYQGLEKDTVSKAYFPHISVGLLIIQIFFIYVLTIVGSCALFFQNDFKFIGQTVGIVMICDVICTLFLLLGGVFSYHHCSLALDEEKITIRRGGFMKETVTIHRKNVIAIEDVTTPLRARKGIYSYSIHLHSNSMQNVIRVEILDKDVRKRLLEFLLD